MANIRNCEHTKDDGSPCGAVPVHNSPYCYFHRKFYNPPALPGEPNYVAPLLESHESIQLAATHLYQSFLSRKMDSKQVALALNILKLAAKSIATVEKARKRAEKEPPAEPQATAPAPDPKVWERASKPVQAERSSVATTAVPPPQPRIYDPYGCMPKNNGTK